MTGKPESENNVSRDSGKSSNRGPSDGASDSNSPTSTRKNSDGDSTALPDSVSVKTEGQPGVNNEPEESNDDPQCPSKWSLVPVHITTDIINTSDYAHHNNYHHGGYGSVNHYSSNSNLDNLYRLYGEGSGQSSSGYAGGVSSFRNYGNKQMVPSLAPEQVSINIRKNLEHCAQQKRQQLENIIRKFICFER